MHMVSFINQHSLRSGLKKVSGTVFAILMLSGTCFAQVATQEHFQAPNAAELKGEAAEKVYSDLVKAMGEGYRLSRNEVAENYLSWQRYNKSPYRSATHGRRFVNNYANLIAKNYGKYEDAGVLPVGAVLAKDSVTVTKQGQASPGPLFIMEKMSAGFNPESGDWRYTMIMPDGSFFGETNGEGSKQVEFCISCHNAAKKFDHLFFMPDSYRK